MTWTRSELKSKAKDVLRGNYWTAFVVALVLSMVTGGGSSSGNSSSYTSNGPGVGQWLSQYWWIILVAVIVVLALQLLVFYPLEAGGRKFFLRAAEGDSKMGYLGSYFSNNYGSAVLTLFLRDLYTFLWSLLFIIPGIIKYYAYRMVPYILADNPDMDANRAIELSNEMTKGEKWQIFVLDLSFILWYIGGMLLFFVGLLFVAPYPYATDAELYKHLREKALNNGITSYEELNQNETVVVDSL